MEGLIPMSILVEQVLNMVGVYNGIVRLRQQVKNAWSLIDVQLKW